MALSKVLKTVKDGLADAFTQVAAKVATPPSAAAPTDSVVTVSALMATDETLVNPATAENQTAANASLSTLDDWDESDRCKVNPIAGQAGVAAGAGAVGATTQRMTLASDDPAVASLGTLDDWD